VKDDTLTPVSTRARLALILLSVLLMAGIFRVSVNGDPAQLVASNTDRYQAYKTLLSDFPGEQNQILIFTEAPAFDLDHLGRYRDVRRPLTDIPEVINTGSLFSVPLLDQALEGLFADPPNAHHEAMLNDVQELLSKVDYLPSRLVSTEQDALLMTVQLRSGIDVSAAVDKIEAVLRDAYPEGTGISWSLAGNPIIELAVTRDVVNELLRVTLLAIALGALVSWWILGSLRSVAMVMAVPITAVACTLGLMGWVGIPLTLLSQAVLTVVFLIVYSDTLHAVRGGRTRFSLLLACSLTSLTSAAAAIALLFASSNVIREFAFALLLGITAGFLVWCLWLLSGFHKSVGTSAWRGDTDWGFNERGSQSRLPWIVLTAFVLLAIPASQLRTGFALDENLPSDHRAAAALDLAEERFDGYLPLQVVVESTASEPDSEDFLERLTNLQRQLNDDYPAHDTPQVRWYSMVDVMLVTPGFTTRQRLNSIPRSLRNGLWQSSNRAVLYAPWSVSDLLTGDDDQLARIDQRVQTLATDAGLTAGLVTGFPALVKEASIALVPDAVRSLGLMLLVLAVLVAGVLKSWRLALIAALPVAFTVVGLAAILVLLGEPLRHAGVVMMTLAAGLAVDNSLHLIIASEQDKVRTARACQDCLPVLWASTLAIVSGFIVLTLSDIPSLSILGLATAGSLALGFIASALWLPRLLAARTISA